MPCTGCGSDFGIFKKEHGCKNCGFAFCSNCLTNKAVVPKLDDRKHSVCVNCFDTLSGRKTSEAIRIAPPAALQRRLDALQEKQRIDAKDQMLMKRIEKLREEKRGKIPTDKELEERLARLKDIPTATSSQIFIARDQRTNAEQAISLLKQFSDEVRLDLERPKPEDEISRRLQRLRGEDELWNDLNNPGQTVAAHGQNQMNFSSVATNSIKPDHLQNFPRNIAENGNENIENMNDADEVNKLMEAAMRETQEEVDRALRAFEADKELQRKLYELKANRNRSSKTLASNEESDNEDENKLADKVIGKLLAETALDEHVAATMDDNEKKEINTPNSENSSDSDELPWCTICNEDATLRCRECDGDLYCHRCFKECHDSFDVKDHSPQTYQPPKRNR